MLKSEDNGAAFEDVHGTSKLGRNGRPMKFKRESLCCALLMGIGAIAIEVVEAAPNLALSLTTNSTQFVEVGSSTAFAFSTNLTVEAWVRFDHTILPANAPHDTHEWIAVSRRAPDGGSAFRLGRKDNFFCFEVATEDGQRTRASVTITYGVWWYVAGVWDGQTVSVYCFDQNASSSRIQPYKLLGSDLPLIIGKEGLSGRENPWQGGIDEVRLWNRAFSGAEINARILKALDGNEPGLVGYWRFDQADGTDWGALRNHGVVHGGAKFTTVPSVGDFPLRVSKFGEFPEAKFAFSIGSREMSQFLSFFDESDDLRNWRARLGSYRVITNQSDQLVFQELEQDLPPRRYYRQRILTPP